jgi:hypothetical protein
MRIYLLRSLDEVSSYADEWDELSRGVPFRGWTWLSHWWRAYGETPGVARELVVPCVFDESERLVGLGPWYSEHSATAGNVLRMLGDGEVCSDYLSILSLPGREEFVADALADYVSHELPDGPENVPWDLIDLTGIDAEDTAARCFVNAMAARGNAVHARPGLNCWRIELPADSDAYYEMLSKNRRKDFRKLEQKYFASERGVVHFVESGDQLTAAMDLFVDMHQRRRQSLGEPGSFASPQFAAFYREVLPVLFRQGRAQVSWLEVDGRPVAADYLLNGDGAVYAYQGAIEPDALKLEPGKVIYLGLLRQAMALGFRQFDFLRGDEPYKATFGAVARPSVQYRIVPPRRAAQLRHNLWLAGRSFKQWISQGLKLVGKKD